MPLRFLAPIHLFDLNPYVLVSPARASALKPKWRKPLPVLVRINGKPTQPWRINMMPRGDGSFYLYLHGEVRKSSKTKVGDKVKVELQFDADYKSGPQHEMTAGLKAELKESKPAAKNWKSLPPSRQKEVLRYLAGLKSPEAIERNVAKTMHVLKGNKARFMGRGWENGR